MPVARTVRIMHRARECKVHAEQTSCPNASEWTELHASLPLSLFPLRPPPPSVCASRLMHSCVHVCTGGTQRYSRGYKVLGAGGERARVNVPRGRISFLSFIPYFLRALCVDLLSLPAGFLRSSSPTRPLSLWGSFLSSFPLTVHYSSHSS